MELNIDFFHVANDNVAEKGRILISEPFLQDHYFRRSIVYLTEHNEDGSLGFVLNKPLEMKVNEIVDDFPEGDFPVSLGGPVSNSSIHYIHTIGESIPGSISVGEGIFWGGDFDHIKGMIAGKLVDPAKLRFFLGYAGWSPGQLNDELEQNAWLVGSISPRMVMEGTDAEIWSSTLERYDNKYKAWANFPEDPGLN